MKRLLSNEGRYGQVYAAVEYNHSTQSEGPIVALKVMNIANDELVRKNVAREFKLWVLSFFSFF